MYHDFSDSANPVWPGNAQLPPKDSAITIEFSFSSDEYNPDGNKVSFVVDYYKGRLLAIDYINSNPAILPNFYIKVNHIYVGASVFDYDYVYKEWLQKKDQYGIAHFSSPSSQLSMSHTLMYYSLDFYVPTLSGGNSAPTLSDKEAFPSFVRTMEPNVYKAYLSAWFCKYLHWEEAGFVYGEQAWGKGLKDAFETAADLFQIRIANTNRRLPESFVNDSSWQP